MLQQWSVYFVYKWGGLLFIGSILIKMRYRMCRMVVVALLPDTILSFSVPIWCQAPLMACIFSEFFWKIFVNGRVVSNFLSYPILSGPILSYPILIFSKQNFDLKRVPF